MRSPSFPLLTGLLLAALAILFFAHAQARPDLVTAGSDAPGAPSRLCITFTANTWGEYAPCPT